MKTYEELRGMTQEDLVRLVLELQDMTKLHKKPFNKGKVIPPDIQDYIKKYFSINPDTGDISRRDRKNSNGSYDKDGYLILKIKGKQYKAHRVAWLLYYGCVPILEIDHVNRNKTDNRKSNLRLSNREINVLNIGYKPNRETGIVGVYIDKSTNGLKKVYATRYKGKLYRFYSLADAVKFRLNNGQRIE